MRSYPDASVLVSLFCDDANSQRAQAYLARHTPALILGDFATAEFAAAVARRVRMRELTRPEADGILEAFDSWWERTATSVETMAADIARIARWLRRPDLNLRAPDALNIALANRAGAVLVTFDIGMAAAARTLGIPVAEA